MDKQGSLPFIFSPGDNALFSKTDLIILWHFGVRWPWQKVIFPCNIVKCELTPVDCCYQDDCLLPNFYHPLSHCTIITWIRFYQNRCFNLCLQGMSWRTFILIITIIMTMTCHLTYPSQMWTVADPRTPFSRTSHSRTTLYNTNGTDRKSLSRVMRIVLLPMSGSLEPLH